MSNLYAQSDGKKSLNSEFDHSTQSALERREIISHHYQVNMALAEGQLAQAIR